MIRQCTATDLPAIHAIVNQAAEAYRGVIPSHCWHEPYMPWGELLDEVHAGVAFSGWEEAGELAGVMGLQTVRDATLIRHAYVKPSRQHLGIGTALLGTLTSNTFQKLLVGTWADALWAIRFYERHGFRLVTGANEKNQLLDTYWSIPQPQRDASVVLRFR